MLFVEMSPRLAVAFERASGEALFALAQEIVSDDLDVRVFVERAPPRWRLRVLGLLVDEVVVERVLDVRWPALDEATKLALLAVYTDELHARHERWIRSMNVKLVALGVRPLVSSGLSS